MRLRSAPHRPAHLFWALIVCLAAAQVDGQQSASSFVVIVHASRSAPTSADAALSRVFLAKDARWPDGSKYRVIDQAKSRPVRSAFLLEIHDMDENEYAKYWAKLVFTGRGKPPEIAENDQDALRRVAADRDAIAYVSASTDLPDSVRVVERSAP